MTPTARIDDTEGWKQIVTKYQGPSRWRAIWQLVNTLVPYGAIWYLLMLSVAKSSWFVVPLTIMAGAFMVRLFILHHDCGHGSFFKSRRANDFWGFVLGVLTFTPYQHWRWEHAIHHSSSGNLDRRGIGDIWTMTAQEYLDASKGMRFAYRLSRNPIVLLVLAPLYLFLVKLRLPNPKAGRRERLSVHLTNLFVLGIGVCLSLAFGLKAYLLIQLAALMLAGSGGIWLFYVQHQFDGVYWQRQQEWDHISAALKGSSFYKLPRVIQWLSGNIGFHHIHHLSPKIPNYNLDRCHRTEPVFRDVPAVTLFASFKALTYHLWDENRQRLVGFKSLRQR